MYQLWQDKSDSSRFCHQDDQTEWKRLLIAWCLFLFWKLELKPSSEKQLPKTRLYINYHSSGILLQGENMQTTAPELCTILWQLPGWDNLFGGFCLFWLWGFFVWLVGFFLFVCFISTTKDQTINTSYERKTDCRLRLTSRQHHRTRQPVLPKDLLHKNLSKLLTSLHNKAKCATV